MQYTELYPNIHLRKTLTVKCCPWKSCLFPKPNVAEKLVKTLSIDYGNIAR